MAILFDFDGTIADTFPDLMAAVNNVLQQQNLPSVVAEELRPLISAGTRAILETILPARLKPQLENLREQLINAYVAANYPQTQPFHGIRELLTKLGELNIPWGIVTNRTSVLTHPLLAKFNLAPAPKCVIGRDNVTNPKPHPEPLFAASKQLAIAPNNCIYIGDAESDVIAGNKAGMHTMAAMFGYIPSVTAALAWPAKCHVEQVQDILPLVMEWHKQHNLLSL